MKKLAILPASALALAALAGGCDGDDCCGPAPTGSVRVTTTTVGDTLDPDGYTVTVDGARSLAVGLNEVVTFAELAEGDHSVELSGVAKNCTVSGANPRDVSVNPEDTVEAGFAVSCAVALFDHIAFHSYRDGDAEVYVMKADGSDPTNLTNDPGSDIIAAWSPDGMRIAFWSDRDGNDEIYVMNADGSDPVNLTNDPAYDWPAVWSPDGSRIAFMSDLRDGESYEIYAMNADGSDPTNLSQDPTFDDLYPVWSPDGTRIAFLSDRDGNIEVYVMNADGSNVANLTNAPGLDGSPDWSPIR